MILLVFLTFVFATFLAFLLNQQVRFIVFLFELVVTICDLITLPVFLFIDQPWKIKLHSKTKCAERHYESNGNYYYWKAKESTENEQLSEQDLAFKSSLAKITHLSELLPLLGKVHKGKKCLGTRKVLGKKVENGLLKFELSDYYDWKSYDEVLAKISELAKILYHKFQLKRGDRVATFVETSPEFLIVFFALQSLGCEVLVIRSTPDESTIPYVLNEHEIELVVTQTNFVKLLNKLKPNIRTVSKLVCFQNPFGAETDADDIQNVKYELFEYDQLLKESQDLAEIDLQKSFEFSPTDISNIITTSGSSGVPKGVLVTHANWLAFLNRNKLGPSKGRTFLAYVEGSQIMELSREFMYFVRGVKLAFGTKDTLLTGYPHLADGCKGDLKASEATHLLTHPQTLEHFRHLIQSSIKRKSPYLATIYDFAYEYKKKWTKRRFRCRLINALFFKRVKDGFSRKLKVIFTGGAPLNTETGTFIKLYLDTPLTLGYGSSETMGAAISSFDQFDHAETLAIVERVKIRLENWEEGGYRVDDRPNARGEIIIGGDLVGAGYYKNEKDTAESFFEENGTRWWRSGDIGEINEYGQLLVIDRIFNFAKLQSGNYYITMSKVESVLRSCRLVENIAVHVNSYCDFVTALVSPNEENIRELANELGKRTDLTELYKDEDLEKAVVDELTRFGTANGLVPVEVPAQVKLVPEKWTPESGLLSETMKVRRRQIYAYYKPLIDAMYKSV